MALQAITSIFTSRATMSSMISRAKERTCSCGRGP
jgi:hypothetical protein